MKKNVVFYFRYSSSQQDTGFSIEAQRRACTEFAEKNNYNIVREYVDKALSGTSDDRPAFMEMISDSKKKQFSLCIVHKMDRFSRDLFQSLYYTNKLKENGVDVVSVSENYDTTTPEGVLLRNMMSTISDYFSKNLSKEVTKGMRENAFQANVNGGKIVYGYSKSHETKKFMVNEEEALVVRKIFDLFNKGYLYAEIVDELDKLGYKTRSGNSFTPRLINSTLTCTKYIGVYTWGVKTRVNKTKVKQEESKVIRIENAVESIISKEVFDKAQKRLGDRSLGTRYEKGSASLLSGKMRCTCGGKMYANPRKIVKNGAKITVRTYRCQNRPNGCKVPEIAESLIIDYILEELLKALNDNKTIESVIKIMNSKVQKSLDTEKLSVKAMETKIATLEKGILSLVKALGKGVAEEEILAEIQRKQEEKAKLTAQIESVNEPKDTPAFDVKTIRNVFDNAKKLITEYKGETPELKAVIYTFVKSIRVGMKEIEIIFNLFSFVQEQDEFDMHYSTTKRNLKKKYRNNYKRAP